MKSSDPLPSRFFTVLLLALLLLAAACSEPVREVHMQETRYMEVPYQGQVSPQTVAELQARYPEGFQQDGGSASLLGGQRFKVTVREFEVRPQNPDMGKTIADAFTSVLIRDSAFEVAERDRLDRVVSEIELRQTGLVDTPDDPTETQVAAAELLVSGSANQTGNAWRLNARVMDATRGRLLLAESSNPAILDARAAEMLARRVAERIKSRLGMTPPAGAPGTPFPPPAGQMPPPMQPFNP
jgi:TolB-like protein